MSITTPAAAPFPARFAAGAWDPVEFHEAAGATVALSRKGRGPVVVCLHATGHGARDFEAFAARVGDAFEVVAVDWPGQGRSPRESKRASARRYAEILEALVPQLASDGPVVVLGCSIGGAAAIELAARRPDLVRGVVACDPGGLIEPDAAARFAVGRMTAFFRAGERGAWWFPRAFALYYAMVLPSPSARAQRDRIVAACRETAPVLAEAWASFGEPDSDLRPKIDRVRCPVFFAWARRDRVLPFARSRAAVERFANRRVEMFDGGHAAFLEDPERFAGSFRDFAASLPAVEASGSRPAVASGSGKAAAVG